MQTDKSFREHLRVATQPHHASLDQLIGPINSRETYRGYVRGIAAFRIPVEDRLASLSIWPERLGAWRPIFLSHWLRRDLAALRVDALSGTSQIDLSTVSRVMGVLYVLQGSTLGARLIVKRAMSLGFDDASGAHHLSIQAGDLAGWKQFLAYLENGAELDRESAVSAACETFDEAFAAMSLIFPRKQSDVLHGH